MYTPATTDPAFGVMPQMPSANKGMIVCGLIIAWKTKKIWSLPHNMEITSYIKKSREKN